MDWHIFGLPLTDALQGGIFTTLVAILGVVARQYVAGAADRKRASNEGHKILTEEHTLIRQDYTKQIIDLRVAMHELRNEMQVLTNSHQSTTKLLVEAQSINRHNKEQMHTMMFLIKLLISELKRIDPDSIIVAQAESTLNQMTAGADPSDSHALEAAKIAAKDARQTVRTTEHAVAELKVNEANK